MMTIKTLEELNNVVNDVVNYIVAESVKNTSTGNWTMEYDDVKHLISEEDYLSYFDFIANELSSRQEVLDLDTADHKFDCIYGLAYCPNYEWTAGDEKVFGMSQDHWEKTFRAEPVEQKLSMARMAQIGKNAIFTIIDEFEIGYIEELNEALRLSNDELRQLGILENHQPAEYVVEFGVVKMQKAVFDDFDKAVEFYHDIESSKKNISFASYDKNSTLNFSVPLFVYDNAKNKNILFENIPESYFNNSAFESSYARARTYLEDENGNKKEPLSQIIDNATNKTKVDSSSKEQNVRDEKKVTMEI